MTLPVGYALAMDAQFRELSNFATPPRAGRITAVEMSGQVRVDCDDPDGGDVLAWPLDGFTYAVNDVVYIAFAVNSPDSAIVLGSKSGEPSGGPYIRKDGTVALTAEWDIGEDMAIRAERLEARDAEGLRIEDDGGNLGILVVDGGDVVVGSNDQGGRFNVDGGTIEFDPGSGADATRAFNFNIASNNYGKILVPSGSGGAMAFWVGSAGAAAERVRITNTGNVGIGVTSPQGKLHVHDGTGGMGLFTKTGVVASSQTIIPNGTGDVVRAVYGTVITTDGSSAATPSAMALRHGGTTTHDVTVGTSTWRTTLNGDGSLTVARTAGTATATISYQLHWM